MFQRVITGIILVLFFVPLLIFSDTPVFTVVVTLLSGVGTYEMLKCLKLDKRAAVTVPSLIIASGAPLCARFLNELSAFAHLALAVIFLYLFWLLAYCVIMRDKIEYSVLSSAFMAVIYITAGFSSLILLRDTTGGEYVFWLVFIGAWVTDTMAYFSGFLFGRHKLIPEVSPKKTIEGAIGGTLFSGLAFMLYGFIISRMTGVDMYMIFLFIAGIISAVVAQFGDLAASIIKRQAKIKDYGNIFPGHGGVLDRFDSIIALAPIILMMHSAPFWNFFK